MTDEQYATADRRYRRRQLLVTIGFALAGIGQVANFLLGDAGWLGLASGIGFCLCSILSAVSWRRGMPDTRPATGGRGEG